MGQCKSPGKLSRSYSQVLGRGVSHLGRHLQWEKIAVHGDCAFLPQKIEQLRGGRHQGDGCGHGRYNAILEITSKQNSERFGVLQ